MLQKIILLSTAILITKLSFATNADSLTQLGLTQEALNAYHLNYLDHPADTNNLYNYTCLLARSRKSDSAFKYASRLAAIYAYPADILIDPDFVNLYEDKRWKSLEDSLVKSAIRLQPTAFKKIDLARKLWRMQGLDQAYYSDMKLVKKAMGNSSTAEQTIWVLKEKINTQNVKELEDIIAKSGWPKRSEVGPYAASSAFLVIQHSDLAHQQKYLPIIKNLCTQKEASWEAYALMYDRVQISSKKKQLYGSQLQTDPVTKQITLSPVEDEANVDKRRAALGMEPLADYLKQWDIVYSPVH